jgi:LytS/YehU family sensor histidine kinase
VIVKTLIQQGVAAAIANTLKGATGLLGLLAIPIAGAAGSLAAGLFSSLIGKITALRNSRLVASPTGKRSQP